MKMGNKKINIIDVAVVVIIIVLALGAVYKFGKFNSVSSTGTSQMQDIKYNVKIEGVREFSADNIEEGDILYDKTSGNAIGTITDIETEQATMVMEMNDGSLLMADMENRINIILTVEAQGTVNETGSFVNKTYELLVGSNKTFYTKYIDCQGKVSEIL